MLQLLRIRNLAIIDELEIELGPGLTVVTGETGAGKSILVSALQLVLGGPGGAGLVRTGEKRAEVEALFDLSDDPAALERLASDGIPVDGAELVVRRVVYESGRTRAYVGGSLASAAQLARLASGLVDISSQHQHHSLVDAGSHLHYLDAFAALEPLRDQVGAAWRGLVGARRALTDAQAALRDRAERQDLLTLQLEAIDKLDPQPGELDQLEAALARLRHADKLLRAATAAERTLSSADRSLVSQLATLLRPLQDHATLDPALAALADRLDATLVELEEAARDLAAYAADIDLDPQHHQALEERFHALRRLARKHGGDLAAVRAWRDDARLELTALHDAEGRIDEREAALRQARATATALARRLSDGRQASAHLLGRAITDELRSLGMGGARVEVAVAPLDGPGDVDVAGARMTASGIDRVEFLIAPNPGEAPRPLAAVASGGELSRSLLALKKVLAGMGPVGLYVFDEVDTGVGGAVAEVIGQKLAQVAAHHQVLCVTHQPQVCVYGDRHLYVDKAVADGRTFSRVRALDPAGRKAEVARMLGGIRVGEAAHQAAGALLDGAARAAS